MCNKCVFFINQDINLGRKNRKLLFLYYIYRKLCIIGWEEKIKLYSWCHEIIGKLRKRDGKNILNFLSFDLRLFVINLSLHCYKWKQLSFAIIWYNYYSFIIMAKMSRNTENMIFWDILVLFLPCRNGYVFIAYFIGLFVIIFFLLQGFHQ